MKCKLNFLFFVDVNLHIIVPCMDNFLLVRPEYQRQRQLKVRFYFKSHNSQGDEIGYNSSDETIDYIL